MLTWMREIFVRAIRVAGGVSRDDEIPNVLGLHRFAPPHAALPYIEIVNPVEYVIMDCIFEGRADEGIKIVQPGPRLV